ncbi:MAG: hypothetical protein FWF54_02705 [Candidatus Azobacteroides sp.]|nr:hypothetical protein [Candidatus Azobacteroides sp.]
MKIIKLFLLMALCTLACITCQSNDDEGSNEYLTLTMNETCGIPNNNNAMTVSFVGVSDNRCPQSSCYLCYGSEAHISLSVTNSKNAKIEFNLSIIGCVDELDNDTGYDLDTLGYRFRLIELSPYPDLDPINKNDYTAKIKITKL